MGKLGAENPWLAVRALMASRGETDSIKRLLSAGSEKTGATEEWISLYGLGGALASEYYSIARNVSIPSFKKHYLEKADSWINVAERTYKMERNLRRQAGLTAIRGHIFLESGRTEEAAEVFDLNLRLRKEAGLSLASMAEAKADLGYAYTLLGRTREAESLLLEGVNDLEASGSPGFVVRAKKKLAVFYFRRLALKKCLQQLVEAEAICENHKILDQLKELRFLRRIPQRIRGWFAR